MRRDQLNLPEFSRFVWQSPAAQQTWEPRLHAVADAVDLVARASIGAGHRGDPVMRRVSLTNNVAPSRIAPLAQWAAEHHLVFLPMRRLPRQDGYTATSGPEPGDHQPGDFAVAITHPSASQAWIEAWQADDDSAMGELLGYPACCRSYFDRIWTKDQIIDPVWTQAGLSDLSALTKTVIALEESPATNLFWRSLGLRMVQHLPCSMGCQPSQLVAAQFTEVAHRLGLATQWEWLTDILSWPVEWSTLHGIAEIKTPILRIIMRSDALSSKLTLQYQGTRYPDEGVTGHLFPYRANQVVPITSLKKFAQGVTDAVTSNEWQANGFASHEAMQEAHRVVLAVGAQATPRRTVLDLGCGNGRLAYALATGRAYGIEADPERAALAERRLGTGHATWGNIFTTEWPIQQPDLVIFFPGRMMEAHTESQRQFLLSRLTASTHVLVYRYSDSPESLETLTRRAGLPWRPVAEQHEPHVSAALLRYQR